MVANIQGIAKYGNANEKNADPSERVDKDHRSGTRRETHSDPKNTLDQRLFHPIQDASKCLFASSKFWSGKT